jgi:hypothetical protein
LEKQNDNFDPNSPVLVCTLKNDIEKVNMQLRHHRQLGVKNFVYIDNMSDDGTFEYLIAQPDTAVYRTDEIYHDARMASWRQQVVEIYGYDRWYLMLDSDELFAYPGYETINIDTYISFLQKENREYCIAPMIDMYSANGVYYKSSKSIFEELCYFDTDTYIIEDAKSQITIFGGPRTRVLNHLPLQMKYGLAKITEDVYFESHYLCFNNKQKFIGTVNAFILHYKFSGDERVKYKEIAETGNYSNNSELYKDYATLDVSETFYYEGSHKLESSLDLLKINIVDREFFKRFFDYCDFTEVEL